MNSALALVPANVRYWCTVAPVVRKQLAHWQRRAHEIDDAQRRSLALDKLRAERFNPRLAATLATLAPRARRREVTEAIVALQVAYDYLDILGEQPAPLDEAGCQSLLGVFCAMGRGESEPHDKRTGGDDYLGELLTLVKDRLARLPAACRIRETAGCAAERCVLAQRHSHRTSGAENEEKLRLWATAQAAGTSLQWPEWLAGAQASVLSLHALIAAAADGRTTATDARALDRLYLRIGALTMLDSLIDREEDARSGTLRYEALFESYRQMADRLASMADEAVEETRRLRHRAHHLMIVNGVVAYYASSPIARDVDGVEVFERLRSELGAPLLATLAVMRAWRAAQGARRRASPSMLGVRI